MNAEPFEMNRKQRLIKLKEGWLEQKTESLSSLLPCQLSRTVIEALKQ